MTHWELKTLKRIGIYLNGLKSIVRVERATMKQPKTHKKRKVYNDLHRQTNYRHTFNCLAA